VGDFVILFAKFAKHTWILPQSKNVINWK